MNKRIAKKVIRNISSNSPVYGELDYNSQTIRDAYRKMHRCWLRFSRAKRTSGWRFGKWDPLFSLHPDELPF